MIASGLQIGGAVLVAVGLGLWFMPLGFIAAGAFALLFGLALENK